MKKLFAIILISTTLLSLVGCNLSKIEIGVRDGAIYFEHSNRVPEVNILVFEGQVQVKDPLFFEKLVSCIDGKPSKEIECVCENNIYVVEIGKHSFALRKDHIVIYSPMGYNIKGVNITKVECTEEEIDELVALLDAARYN